MGKHKNILLFSLVLIGIGIIIGLPTFLSGCNLSAIKYCAFSYNKFNGYVYETEIKEDKCGRSGNECWNIYSYASNTQNYNISTTQCIYTVEEGVKDKSSANNYAKEYYVGKPVSWYKKTHSDSCFDKSTLTQLWYVGIIFFSFAGSGLLLCIGIHFVEHITKTFRENYNKCSTDQNKNIDIEIV